MIQNPPPISDHDKMPKPPVLIPTLTELVAILKSHPLIQLRHKPKQAFVVGSFAKGSQGEHSDLDILFEIRKNSTFTAEEIEDSYRRLLRQYFVQHNIQGKADHIHPQWCERRIDLYFTFDADQETRPKMLLPKRPQGQPQAWFSTPRPPAQEWAHEDDFDGSRLR